MRAVAEGTEVLRAVGWLSRMPEEFREAVLARSQWRLSGSGEAVIHAGEMGGMCGIAEGTVEVSAEGGPPDSMLVHLGHAGFWAGNRPLLTGQPRRVSIVALDPTLWANIPLAAMRLLLTQRPEWWQCIGQLSEEAGALATSALADMTLSDSRRRGIAVLLRLAGCRYADPQSRELSPVRLRVTQLQLAEFSNVSRQTESGLLRALQDEGLIEIGYHEVVLLDAAALRRIVDNV